VSRCGFASIPVVVGSCGSAYDASAPRCAVKPLVDVGGRVYGFSRCPGLAKCREEAEKR